VDASSRCSGCRLTIAGGTAGCQAIFDELAQREYGDFRYGRSHRLRVDTYCLQHPDRYCASAKSLMAHLTGLCAAMEYPTHPTLLGALQHSLDGKRAIERPVPPAFRGALTIADVRDPPDADAYSGLVERWARSTWVAYRPLQPVARAWIRRIIGSS
jgi:hypothetical protein